MKTQLHFHGNGRAYEPCIISVDGEVVVTGGMISSQHGTVLASLDVRDLWHLEGTTLSFPAVTITTESEESKVE